MPQSTLIKFPVTSFRRIENPYEGKGVYVSVVSIKDLPPSLEEWRGINPRDPNLKSGVAKMIAATLKDNPSMFFFLNRGITLMAAEASFDNKTNTVSLEMEDREKNGLLDGGHTFRVIRNFIETTPPDELPNIEAYVRLEIIVGVNELSEAASIVESRNTSIQVKEQSIVELKHGFDAIKKAIAGKPYDGRIAYKEYELGEDESKKDIDVKEVLSYLVCFDIENFDQQTHPIIAYSGKTALVDYFVDHSRQMDRLIPLLPKILELRDTIYRDIPKAYNETGGKFGALKGVTEVTDRRMADTHLNFIDESSTYRIPMGFIYPILAAFRNLIEDRNDKYSWKTDPIKFFEEQRDGLAQVVGTRAKELQNPQSLGKDASTWTLCYQATRVAVLERSL